MDETDGLMRVQIGGDNAQSVGTCTRDEYLLALETFDIAVCDTLAVGQAQAGRYVAPCIGYATFVYARLSSHGVAAVRAAPLSRWVRSDSQCWNLSVIACHARAILEGLLYFIYLVQPTDDAIDESRARIALLQLNDCCSRLKLLASEPESVEHFTREAELLRERLQSIPFFQQLPYAVQQTALAGKKAWFADRAQLLDLAGIDKPTFDPWWDLLSQHSHIHPVSFFRNEPNGRGSGLECEVDRSYLATAMTISAEALSTATDQMVTLFADVAWARKGLNSKFNPGPKANRRR